MKTELVFSVRAKQMPREQIVPPSATGPVGSADATLQRSGLRGGKNSRRRKLSLHGPTEEFQEHANTLASGENLRNECVEAVQWPLHNANLLAD